MSRSMVACRKCGATLGARNQSGIFHPADGITVTFVDLDARTSTLLCRCGATTQHRGGRLHLVD